MIIDSSAVVAIIMAEPEADGFVEAILSTPACRLSAASEVELAAVGIRRGLCSIDSLRALIAQLGLVIEPVTLEQARIGQEAYAKYGIGSGHPAKLNFGDCFAYALAKARNLPLLTLDQDFRSTDVSLVLPGA